MGGRTILRTPESQIFIGLRKRIHFSSSSYVRISLQLWTSFLHESIYRTEFSVIIIPSDKGQKNDRHMANIDLKRLICWPLEFALFSYAGSEWDWPLTSLFTQHLLHSGLHPLHSGLINRIVYNDFTILSMNAISKLISEMWASRIEIETSLRSCLNSLRMLVYFWRNE